MFTTAFLFISLLLSQSQAQNQVVIRQQQTVINCANPQGVLNCYIQYLAKYGIRPTNGYLPPFIQLERYVTTQINLFNTCRDFDELQQCLGPTSATCVSIPVFSLYTQRFNIQNEAIFYLQNHAFFEFVCGVGRQNFFANSECLSKTFAGSSLTGRMHSCTTQDLTNNCAGAMTLASCVKESIALECGPMAAAASCGAATNIIRREGDVDAGCLFQMDALCNSANAVSQIIAIFMVLIFNQ